MSTTLLNNKTESPVKQGLIAGLYARVSTGRQEQEATIDSQLSEIKAKIKEDGNILSENNIFIDDGWTGEIFIRPALDEMRDAAKQNAFQILYVYDRGRIARKFAYQEIVLEELENLEITFVTLHDVQAVTPEEKVLQAMQGVFHEYEKVKIAERFRRGKLFKAKSKIMINGHAVYGYNYIKKSEDNKTPAHYEINEEEAKVVRKIFEWVGIEKISLREVINRLYRLGILPRKRKRDVWTKGPVVRLLKCEAYAKGLVYYNKHEAIVARNPIKNIKYKKIKKNSRRLRPKGEWFPYQVPIIIDDNGLFEEVQKILTYNQKFARKNRKYEYLLTGRVFCACGKPRAGDGSSKQGHHYYRCAERIYQFPKEGKCKIPGINAEALDSSLWKNLVKFLKNPLTLKDSCHKFLQFEARGDELNQHEEKHILESIEKLGEEEKRYAKAYGTGTLEFEQFQELIKECDKEKNTFKKQLEALKYKQNESKVKPSAVNDLCLEARKVIESLDISNKILVIRDLIDKVIVGDNRKVEVFGHIPLIPLKLEYGTINWSKQTTNPTLGNRKVGLYAKNCYCWSS